MTWVPGKSHVIADASSCAPLFAPEEVEDIAIDTAHVCLTKSLSNQLNIIFDAIDSYYMKLRQDVCNGTFHSIYANQLKSVMSQFSVDEDIVYLDGARIVLPKNAVKAVLPFVYIADIGMNKTCELCRSLYFWPGMFKVIKQMITQRKLFNVYKPFQPKNPRSTLPPSSYLGPSMSHVGLDLFDFCGKQHLIFVDHWSEYPMFSTVFYHYICSDWYLENLV